MFVLRLLGILVVIAFGVGILLYVLTGQKKHLKFSLQLLKWSVIFALVIFALLAAERLITLV